jgi:hypothetical protein
MLETMSAIQTATALSKRALEAIALDRAETVDPSLVPLPRLGSRTWSRVEESEYFDVWLIRWGARSSSPLHDHGDSAGALCVVARELVEYQPDPARRGPALRRTLRAFETRAMSASHVHEIVNESPVVATSVHVYSPPLQTMRRYDSSLEVVHRELVTAR